MTTLQGNPRYRLINGTDVHLSYIVKDVERDLPDILHWLEMQIEFLKTQKERLTKVDTA